jgi:hypothetical protein
MVEVTNTRRLAMNLFDQCSRMLQLSLIALLCACSGGLDRDDGVGSDEPNAISQSAEAKDVACAAPDAGPGIAPDAALDAGPPLSTRPGERCGPAGEGDFPWAPCDTARGLVCVAPDPELLDAPATCACPAGKVFTEGACSAK